ncbi:MAG: GNAT family N-acetyltransferase [Polyangiaceae bacterium]|nr:GNAT family N-acetyltransferase [Polyangiaceae bacterium]MCW5789837.1 GNAT family N-acetyltransferase [Polyangiaceae bacterium]
MSRPEVSIRDLTRADVPRAAEVLARAFTTNPGIVAIFSDVSDTDRIPVLERLYRRLIEACILGAVARGAFVQDELVGAQLAYEPGQFPLSGSANWLMLKGLWEAGPRYVHRLVIADALLRGRHISTPHCYLFMLGVDPAQQGRGFGGALLRDFNERARRLGVDAYLETDRTSAYALYRHDGYRTLREEVFGLQGYVRTWFMLKPLAALQAHGAATGAA